MIREGRPVVPELLPRRSRKIGGLLISNLKIKIRCLIRGLKKRKKRGKRGKRKKREKRRGEEYTF